MLQAIAADPFTTRILAAPAVITAGRWAAIGDARPIGVLARRRTAPALSCVRAVKAVTALAEGAAAIRLTDGADPALVATVKTGTIVEQVGIRIRSRAVITTVMQKQSSSAAVPFAARLLAARVPDFCAAYLALLDGMAKGLAQPALDSLAVTAADELVVAIDADLGIAAPDWVWLSQAKPAAAEFGEAADPRSLSLSAFFSNPASVRAYVERKPGLGGASALDRLPALDGSASGGKAGKAAADGPDTFFGRQLALAIRHMRVPGRHIMYHGPTGTGKNTVWRLAMGEVFGDDFSLRTYRYFVQGSGGLEDIDFIGGYKKIGDRIEWIDGPLVRAMRDGKRFKIDEMNRLPARMLNVILDAMENSQIALTAKDGEIVNAAPGFAIDAMANIGDEYVGTERIDPSVMNRFTIKIEFDFLEPAEEKRLLRSRHPKLSATAADSLTVIAKAIRDAHAHGSSAVEVDMYVSPRALLNTAMLVVEGDSILDAVSTTWLADVAWSKAKRKSVIALVNLKAKKP